MNEDELTMNTLSNQVTILMQSLSMNESFARMAVAAFITPFDPTVNEMTDIKTAVSEAVTNAIIHGYENKEGVVHIRCVLESDAVSIDIWDEGAGIADIEKALEPLYTSKPELERSGMGFTVMESFTDTLEVFPNLKRGVKVKMTKNFDMNKNAEE